LFVWVILEAALVAGFQGGMLAWTGMSIIYGIREGIAAEFFDQAIDVGTVILRLFIGLATALVAGSLSLAADARREADHEREYAVLLGDLDERRNMFLRALSHRVVAGEGRESQRGHEGRDARIDRQERQEGASDVDRPA
jgi:hypothetical protein